jgi:hypothetical protein
MTLTLEEFCPPVDALTLLQFRSDAYQAWVNAPSQQDAGWLMEYKLINDLLELAGAGPVKLGA